MSEEADRLAEMARNRGLKLLRSRVRTPGRPGFGMFGLTDAKGEPAFGIRGKRALRASGEEIEDFLRKLETNEWKASLSEVGPKRAATVRVALPATSAKPKLERLAKAKHPSPSVNTSKAPAALIREAASKDADALASLFSLLGHRVSTTDIRENLKDMTKAGDRLLVATNDGVVVGACGVHSTTHPHRPEAVGRISILVVAEAHRGDGIGRSLVKDAEERLAKLGCGLVEVTSNDKLQQAHNFYKHLGFERTSVRFAKTLGSR